MVQRERDVFAPRERPSLPEYWVPQAKSARSLCKVALSNARVADAVAVSPVLPRRTGEVSACEYSKGAAARELGV
jgi:hypothetical protein